MGNEASKPAEGQPKNQLQYKHGYQIVKVNPNSPGSEAQLGPFFDIIVKCNDFLIDKKENPFIPTLFENKGKSINLLVYNTKTESVRSTTITPNNTDNPSELVGLHIKFCDISTVTDFVWHVLEVYPNSPASKADIIPYTDYIIGSDTIYFIDSEDFVNLINDNMNKPVTLSIYNSDLDTIRLATIVPNKSWGGQGSLGCNVGSGLLHRIPTKSSPGGIAPIPTDTSRQYNTKSILSSIRDDAPSTPAAPSVVPPQPTSPVQLPPLPTQSPPQPVVQPQPVPVLPQQKPLPEQLQTNFADDQVEDILQRLEIQPPSPLPVHTTPSLPPLPVQSPLPPQPQLPVPVPVPQPVQPSLPPLPVLPTLPAQSPVQPPLPAIQPTLPPLPTQPPLPTTPVPQIPLPSVGTPTAPSGTSTPTTPGTPADPSQVASDLVSLKEKRAQLAQQLQALKSTVNM